MNNLSFEEGLLKEHAAEPLEGHHVVVFERVGQSGERFHTVLAPGSPLRAGLLDWLRPGVRHFGIAVDAAAELHLDLHEHVVLSDDAAHRFDLLGDLYYAAADPQLLASHRNRDPLAQVRARVVQVARRELSQMLWNTIVYDFPAAAEALAVRHLPTLQAFAATYGIALRGVELRRLLLEEDSAPVRGTEDDLDQIVRDERVELKRSESQRRLKDADAMMTLGSFELDVNAQAARQALRLQEASLDNAVQSGANVAAGVRTPEELRALFARGMQPFGLPTHPALAAVAGEPSGTALPPPAPGPAAALQRIVTVTQCVPGYGKRLKVRAALLHLAAEVLLEDLGDAAVRARYAESAATLVASLDGLPPHEAEALTALTHPAELERALRG